jgi:hypothetical protein
MLGISEFYFAAVTKASGAKGDHRGVAQPFGFRPHRSGRAAVRHPALPESNPGPALAALLEQVMRGRGKRSAVAVTEFRLSPLLFYEAAGSTLL